MKLTFDTTLDLCDVGTIEATVTGRVTTSGLFEDDGDGYVKTEIISVIAHIEIEVLGSSEPFPWNVTKRLSRAAASSLCEALEEHYFKIRK